MVSVSALESQCLNMESKTGFGCVRPKLVLDSYGLQGMAWAFILKNLRVVVDRATRPTMARQCVV